jgi:hypothetical protein
LGRSPLYGGASADGRSKIVRHFSPAIFAPAFARKTQRRPTAREPFDRSWRKLQRLGSGPRVCNLKAGKTGGATVEACLPLILVRRPPEASGKRECRYFAPIAFLAQSLS